MSVFLSRKQKRKEDRINKKLNKNMFFQMKNKSNNNRNNMNNSKINGFNKARQDNEYSMNFNEKKLIYLKRKKNMKNELNLKETNEDNFSDESSNENDNYNGKYNNGNNDEEDEEINSDEASLHPDDDSEVSEENIENNLNKNSDNNELNEDDSNDDNFEEDKLFGKEYYNKNIKDKIDYSKIDDDLEKELKYLEKKLKLKKGKNLDLLKKRMVKDNYDDDLFDLLDSIDNKDSNSMFVENKKSKKLIKTNSNDNEGKVNIKNVKLSINENTNNYDETIISDNRISKLKKNSQINDNTLKKEDILTLKTNNDQDLLTFKKSINSLFNKTSDSNIMILYKDVIDLVINQINKIIDISKEDFQISSKASGKKMNKQVFEKNLYDMINCINGVIFKSVFENEFMNIGITSCLITYVCIIQSVLGDNFLKLFLTQIFDKFYQLNKETVYDIRVNKLRNFVFIMIFIFLNKAINLKLANDLISFLITNFDEYYSEILYILISHIGIFIRREQPDSIKQIISQVKQKYDEVKNSVLISSKFKFVVDMIEEIKDNKFLKFNLGEKYGFLKNLVNTNKKNNHVQDLINLSHKEFLLYFGSNDEIEISLNEIDSFIASGKFINESFFELLNCENKMKNEDKKKIDDLSNNDNSNDEFSIDSEDIEQEYSIIKKKSDLKNDNISDFNRSTTDKFNSLCKQLKINTDLKKKIFKIIVFAEDFKDSYEKLLKLNLNKEQSREIIKICVLTSVKETEFNKFYYSLISMFIKYNKDYKYTFQYTCWDYIRNFDNLNKNETKNLSLLICHLLKDNLVNFTTLLPLNVTNKDQHLFLKEILEFYLNNTEYNNLKILISKLVKNDSHNDFYTRLLGLLNSEFQFKSLSNQDINSDLNSKITMDEMKRVESYNDNLKEFRRILKKVVIN